MTVATKMKYSELTPGEIYETTKEWFYSEYQNEGAHIKIPEKSKLLFRCTWDPATNSKIKPGKELVVFYWLDEKISVCLTASSAKPVLYIKHISNKEKGNKDHEKT